MEDVLNRSQAGDTRALHTSQLINGAPLTHHAAGLKTSASREGWKPSKWPRSGARGWSAFDHAGHHRRHGPAAGPAGHRVVA